MRFFGRRNDGLSTHSEGEGRVIGPIGESCDRDFRNGSRPERLSVSISSPLCPMKADMSVKGHFRVGSGRAWISAAWTSYLSNMQFSRMRRVPVRGASFPCLPTLALKPPSGPDWIYEIKQTDIGPWSDGTPLLICYRNKGEFNDAQAARGSASPYHEHLGHGPQ